jgi:hypothetical protein
VWVCGGGCRAVCAYLLWVVCGRGWHGAMQVCARERLGTASWRGRHKREARGSRGLSEETRDTTYLYLYKHFIHTHMGVSLYVYRCLDIAITMCVCVCTNTHINADIYINDTHLRTCTHTQRQRQGGLGMGPICLMYIGSI